MSAPSWRPDDVRLLLSRELGVAPRHVRVGKLGVRQAGVAIEAAVPVRRLDRASDICYFDLGVNCTFELQIGGACESKPRRLG